MVEAGNEFNAYGDAERAAGQKSPDAFRTISEVSADLDVPQHVLRFWEGKFTQIKPLKRGGGRRYYRPDDVDLLRGIQHLLYGDGYTIKGVQKLLREHGVKFVTAAGRRPVAPPKETSKDKPAPAVPAPAAVDSPAPVAAAPIVLEPAPIAAEIEPAVEPHTLAEAAPATDSARFERAARLFGKLKALRREYDQKLQAAKNGRA